MGAGRCARLLGVSLVPLALVSMAASVALLFPNGDARYIVDGHITWWATIQAGVWGSGVLVIVAALRIIAAAAAAAVGDSRCCLCRSGRIKMLSSVFYSLLAIIGSVACFIISIFGMAKGPLCLFSATLPNKSHVHQWDYPFIEKISEINYLYDPMRWRTCEEPKNIVLWNIVLFSILVAISCLEVLLCSIQIINGLLGCIIGG
ncbi:transmembrane 4 L6 family member 1-like isoform X1 [Narcine bancroftii]|uniref:transmembrane 4 L6 family member 1-like isoform X1 n=1 Tax=Narcine bancroftii TaxID=1343680 RepID=UPI003831A853